MTPKPTNDEVEWIKLQALTWLDKYDADILVNLCNAYLAQEEELEVVELEKHTMCEAWGKQNEIIDQLQAENQALQDKVDEYELGYRGFP